MGFWGSSLYANDCTCDVRDSYMDLLENGASKEDAYQKMLNDFSEYIGTDEEPLFWYALADTQWRVGRLDDEVKEQALSWIRRKGGEELWLESRNGASGWLKTLAKLEDKLNQPQPKEKRFLDLTNVQWNPWNMGDVYAYCFHSKKAETMGYSGKYILLQKIAEEEIENGRFFSSVRVLDKVFAEIPSIPSIIGIRTLPCDLPERFENLDSRTAWPCLKMKTTLYMRSPRAYPRKYLHFIGNYPYPTAQEYHISWNSPSEWSYFEQSVLTYLDLWKDYDYQLGEKESVVTCLINTPKKEDAVGRGQNPKSSYTLDPVIEEKIKYLSNAFENILQRTESQATESAHVFDSDEESRIKNLSNLLKTFGYRTDE